MSNETNKNEKILEVNESAKAIITEVDESNLAKVLESAIDEKVEIIEKSVQKKQNVDAITKTVPSSVISTPGKIASEMNAAERERLRRRSIGL